MKPTVDFRQMFLSLPDEIKVEVFGILQDFMDANKSRIVPNSKIKFWCCGSTTVGYLMKDSKTVPLGMIKHTALNDLKKKLSR